MTNRERLIELFYENNVRCDQTVEHLADDVEDIFSDIINPQKAEIERLRKSQVVHVDISEQFKKECEYEIKTAKAEAIKAFAERLKETKFKHGNDHIIYADNIDHLVKETVGDNNVNTARKEDEGK